MAKDSKIIRQILDILNSNDSDSEKAYKFELIANHDDQEISSNFFDSIIYLYQKDYVTEPCITRRAGKRNFLYYENFVLTADGYDYFEKLQSGEKNNQEQIIKVQLVNSEVTVDLSQDTLDQLQNIIITAISTADLKKEEKDTLLHNIKNLPKNTLPSLTVEAIKAGIPALLMFLKNLG